jgi:hypothetical protein
MAIRKQLRHPIFIEVDDDCVMCGGSGLQIHNAYRNDMSKLDVVVRSCPCVKLVIKPVVKEDVKTCPPKKS